MPFCTISCLEPQGWSSETPDGLSYGYRNLASQCLQAAKRLESPHDFNVPEYILLFHSIELGLKGFLVKSGVTPTALRKRPYGHNLVNLYRGAIKRGMIINCDAADAASMLSLMNNWQVEIRYNFFATCDLPKHAQLIYLADAILAASR